MQAVRAVQSFEDRARDTACKRAQRAQDPKSDVSFPPAPHALQPVVPANSSSAESSSTSSGEAFNNFLKYL